MIKIQSGILDILDNKSGMRIESIKRGCSLVLDVESNNFLITYELSKNAIIELIDFLQKEIEE